ncbi:MAG: hypothetical protein CMJ64_23660 [Planctomycetaceae bacterium]|nr:hypothetical protein [Planctomycetaceae bacterium]
MITAKQHMDSIGRSFTDKVVIVLSDGAPNLIQSGQGTIDGYVNSVSGPDAGQFYYSDPLSWPNSRYWFNGPLMQARNMRLDNWDVFAVGLGFGADGDFLNRMAVLGGTSEIGQGLQAGGDPSQYEEQLTNIFKDIIFTPTVRLVD